MIVNIEAVAHPARANGVRDVPLYVYSTEEADPARRADGVRDCNHALQIVHSLIEGEGFFEGRPPREAGYDPMWTVQMQVSGTRRGTSHYRVAYHKHAGCPMSIIGDMMELYRDLKRILRTSAEELRAERNGEGAL